MYDSDVVRVYVLVHDSSREPRMHISTLQRQLQAQFSARRTKMIVFNNFAEEAANHQQPDLWSRWLIPMYNRESVPSYVEARETMPVTKGCRLSMDDFMMLRGFCMELFQQEIVPALERRVLSLTKQVSDSRKGMKNVLKSFWRKPRDESSARNEVRYKADRIEFQTLLLADTSFVLRVLDIQPDDDHDDVAVN